MEISFDFAYRNEGGDIGSPPGREHDMNATIYPTAQTPLTVRTENARQHPVLEALCRMVDEATELYSERSETTRVLARAGVIGYRNADRYLADLDGQYAAYVRCIRLLVCESESEVMHAIRAKAERLAEE